MVTYLVHVFKHGFFVFALVPAIFLGVFKGLLELGFSGRLLDVWGLAVVGGSLVLLVLKAISWTGWKIMGSPPPKPAPEPPAWARRAAFGGALTLGGTGAVAATFGVLVFATVGTWPRIPASGPVYLGELVSRPKPEGGHVVRFVPRGKIRDRTALEVQLGGTETVMVEVLEVRFSGHAKTAFAWIDVQDAVLPWNLFQKETAEADPGDVGDLVSRFDAVIERVLDGLRKLPGVAVKTARTSELTLGTAPLERGVEVLGGKVRYVEPREVPDEPAPVEPADPSDPPPASPTPTAAPPPTRAPTPTPSPTAEPPLRGGFDLAADPALFEGEAPPELYPGDPFEGLD